MAIYGYVRVSTTKQSEDGLSLDAQERQIKGYAMMKGMVIDEIFTERAVSGWKPISNRPTGKLLMSSLSAGDVIICSKLDRMFRSAKDALVVSEELREQDVSLHMIDLGGDVTANGISKVFFTIVAAFAEFERDRIAERICDVKSSEREKGRYLGGSRPFGYTINENGDLDPNVNEQKIIFRVLELRHKGKSLRAISSDVSDNGFKVSHVTVKKIVQQAGSE